MEEVKVLSKPEEILSAYLKLSEKSGSDIQAFYHGGLNAIILNKDLALVHFSDRQVHRGYAVFDTCTMFNRRLYLFDQHMDRFFNSMKVVELKPPKTKEQIKALMMQMAKLIGTENLWFRYWCSRGGNRLWITTPPEEPTVFYMMATPRQFGILGEAGIQDACTVKTEVKGEMLASVKSTNYLLNSLAAEEAKKKGCVGIMVTEDGYVTESPIDSIGVITKDKMYYVPPYYRALKSTTQERGLILIERHLISKGILKGIVRDRRKVEQLKEEAEEMFLLGGDELVPIRSWDGKVISKDIGPITKELIKIFDKDLSNSEVTCEVS